MIKSCASEIVLSKIPFFTSHIVTLQSWDTATIVELSDVMATPVTACECPRRVRIQKPKKKIKYI